MPQITFNYRFVLEDGRTIEHAVVLDKTTGMAEVPDVKPEAWTALEFNKCEHCPLNANDHPQCPVARNLSAVAKDFIAEKSYARVKVEVVSAERAYSKNLALQDGLFGLFGLIMATSSCPYFTFLRPMARFHLPFSSLEETMVRSTSFYLMKQYFVAQKGGPADFNLQDFSKCYENLNKVNQGIAARIQSMAKADADVNSVVSLDSFACILTMEASNQFSELAGVFA